MKLDLTFWASLQPVSKVTYQRDLSKRPTKETNKIRYINEMRADFWAWASLDPFKLEAGEEPGQALPTEEYSVVAGCLPTPEVPLVGAQVCVWVFVWVFVWVWVCVGSIRMLPAAYLLLRLMSLIR